ncbi:MAG: hypothetical protein HC825_11970 [Oscillatoriales cyanobacterium RM1_1_9]|nr:hypothetical protein [Oscillatoriales cyanobacterium SM2_3_0]NJO47479.1 hypothetical protein [Oscillatoriales cyanobacterium RM2_1_1]NJO72187.1 hypothetical protein [Oscillatoriales cyanobacterium RM1_1_9]
MKAALKARSFNNKTLSSSAHSPEIPTSNDAWDIVNPFAEWEGNPFDAQDLDQIPTPVEGSSTEAEAEPLPPQESSEPSASPSWNSLLTPQMGLAVAILLGCVYTLSRPCVIGECRPVSTAQEFAQKSEQTLQSVTSAQAPGLAQEDLEIAIKELKRVPFWSPYYREARSLMADYQQDAQALDETITGLRFAGTAAQSSQNPPYSLEEWAKVKSDWENAVAQLELVDPDSSVYPFAQQRLQQYQANLAEIRQRLTVEQRAAQTLKTAKKMAQVAAARQGVAKYADSWEQVYETWETATNTLALIPNGTAAHEDAQVLLARYQPKLEGARDRKTIEAVGQDAYNRAVGSADQAKVFEERGAWSDAARYWSRAVSYAKRVPQTSTRYVETKPLINSYNQSWKQAEAQNRSANRMNKARQDLSNICNSSLKSSSALRICEYSVTPDLITVRLTPEYIERVQKTATPTNQSQPSKTRAEAQKHVQTLEVALASISDNAKIALEVHKPGGEKAGVHIPD